MAIIIREEKKLPNGVSTQVKHYISDFSPITGRLRRIAEKNDELIDEKVKEMEAKLESKGLLDLRGKPNVLPLWYEVGKHLDFVDELELSPKAKKHVWRAIYDHCRKLYNPDDGIPVRLRDRPTTSNLRYAYLLAKNFDWDLVKNAGNWTAWVEFLDSIVMREDPRIIEWIRDLQDKGPLQGGFLRVLNKAIRHRLDGHVTELLSDSELRDILEEVHKSALENRLS